MFKKLKDKIAEEVKQSPLKTVQQLAQAVVSPSSSSVFEPSSSNDKFCIDDGDTKEEETASQMKTEGFTSVALTGQTTSPLREQGSKYGFRSSSTSLTTEADNLFPIFEPQPSTFHVQSDWESASEVEDRYSQLEHINKESLYEAYRKVYNRYNKKKNKYKELVTHYYQLEKEKEKARTVLSATQDKALLRISELKEQCLLEQQAKAHLEEALRNELEERDHIINTLKTKVQYLKNVNDSNVSERLKSKLEFENLIDFTDSTVLTKVPLPSPASTERDCTDWTEKQVKRCKEFLNEKALNIETLKKQIEELDKQKVEVEDFDPKVLNASNKDQAKEVRKHDEKYGSIQTSLIGLLDELSKEVKSIQENVGSQFDTLTDTTNTKLTSLHLGPSTNAEKPDKISISRGLSDGPYLDVQESHVKGGHDIKTISDDVTLNLAATIKELEKENELLRDNLEKESHVTKQVVSEINLLKQTLSSVKVQLQKTNEKFVAGTLKVDNIDTELSLDSDFMRELNLCVQRLCTTKYDLNNLEHLTETLENNIKSMQSEIEILKAENNQLLTLKDQFHAEVTVQSNQLKEQFLSIQKENSLLLAEKESLILEISSLKSKNEEVEAQIKNMHCSISNLEKECLGKQTTLDNTEVNFSKEKKAMEDKISRLELEVGQANENLLSAQEKNKEIEAEFKLLKSTNIDIVNEKNTLLSKLNEIQTKLEINERDYKEIEEKLSHSLLLKEQDDNTVFSEKEEFYKRISILEENLKRSNQDYAHATQTKDLLSEELASLRKEYDNCADDKLQTQNKLLSLEQELETCKCDLLKMSESEKELSDELHALKKRQDEYSIQSKELQNEVFALTIENEDYKTQRLSEDKVQQNMIQEMNSLMQTNENLKVENSSLLNKVVLLEEEIIRCKADVSSKVDVENKLSEKLTALRNEVSKQSGDSNELQDKYDNLCREFSKSKEDYIHLLEIKNKLSGELISVTNCKDELNVERNNLQNKVEVLTKDFQHLEEKLANAAKDKHKLSEEIYSLKSQEKKLDAEKLQMKIQIEELETKIESSKRDMLLTLGMKNKLDEEVAFLKTEIDDSKRESNTLTEKLNSSLIELDEKSIDHTNILKLNDKLVEDLASLRKEYNETCCLLKKTKEQSELQQTKLENAEKYSLDLTQQLSLLESKCINLEKQSQENTLLKSNLESLQKKILHSDSVLEQYSLEKQRIVDNIQEKLTDIRKIRTLQENLLEWVLKFRLEILEELKYLKTKVAVDLMEEANSILQKNKQNIELEVERMDESGTYCKIKYIEGNCQEANKDTENVLNNHTSTGNFILEETKKETDNVEPQGDQCCAIKSESIENISNISDKATYYQNKFYDVEIKLKQAFTFLKCLSNSLLMHDSNSTLSSNGDGFLPETDPCVIINCMEKNNVKKQLASLKLFLKEYEEKPTMGSIDLADMDPHCVTSSLLDNNNDSIILKSEISENFSGCNSTSCKDKEVSDRLKVSQLLEEMQVKDDIIKELQQSVEECEEQKVTSSSRNTLSCQSDSWNNSEINDSNELSVDKHDNYAHLEEDNKALLQQIQQLKKTHETTIKAIKAEYELLEDREKHTNICEKEEIGSEQKFIVNELKEQIGNLQQDLDERGDAFEKLYEEHKNTVKTKDMEVQQVRNNYEKEMREQDKKWRSCLDRRLTEEEKRHQEEVTELTRTWSAERKELETASRLAVSVVESGSSSSDMLRRQVQALTMQLNQLERNRCEECEHQKSYTRRKSFGSSRSIQDCTEMEYLRNILYEYMMGKEPLVLAKVLCALVKFDENQTQDIVLKEKQKITVLGQLGIPL